MFSLSIEPIDIDSLQSRLSDDRAGAVVTFEGRVRNHNDGRAVIALEYEAYGALALKEGERIIAEARFRFGIYDCVCVHRTGRLAIADIAVWVGVLAAHRGEAFDACRFIIDEVKHRVPIWKKEYYSNGDSGWVNCAEHTHAGAQEAFQTAQWQLDALDLSSADLARYQIIDVREPAERAGCRLTSLFMRNVVELPGTQIDVDYPPFERDKHYLLVCQSGAVSARLVDQLRRHGWNNVYALAGGAEAMRRKFIA